MSKTIEEWLGGLPPEVSKKALANVEDHFKQFDHCNSVKEALMASGDFVEFNEGYSYWNTIANCLTDGVEDCILVIDIEATDFTPKTGTMIELGIVSLNLQTGEITTLFDNVLHREGITRMEVERSWIIENSTLTVEMVQHSLELDNYFDEIQAIFDLFVNGVTAFNKEFDFRFTDDAGIIIDNRLDCPMVLSKPYVEALNKNGAIKNPSVQEAYDYFFPDSGYIEEHRAGSDARHEAEIVYELHKLGNYFLK